MKMPLIGPSGLGRFAAQNARRAINLHCEVGDAGGKEKIYWIGTPGLKSFCDVAGVLRGHPIRFGSLVYFVAGTGLYTVNSSGTVSASLGTIPGTGNVSMERNRGQVVVANGTQHIYVYDTALSLFYDVTCFAAAKIQVTKIENTAGTTFQVTAAAHGMSNGQTAQITGTANFNGSFTVANVATNTFEITVDPAPADETGLTKAYVYTNTSAAKIQPDHVTAMDGRILVNNANSGDGLTTQRCYFSALDDATLWDSADFFSAQRDPDAMVRPFAHGGDLLLFGEQSLEPWYNSGTGDIPYEPSRAAATAWGLLAPWSLALVGDGVAWVATRPLGGRTVVLMEGYQPVEIANHALSYRLREASEADVVAATAYTRREGDHEFYRLAFGSETWEYDAIESKKAGMPLWTEVQSSGSKHRGKWYCYAFGKHLVSDHTNAQILELDAETYTDLGAAITRVGVGGYIHDDDNPVTHNRVGLDISAMGTVLLESSDDGGTTFVSHGSKTIARRTEWFGLGTADKDRVYRYTTTAAGPVAIFGAWVDVEGNK